MRPHGDSGDQQTPAPRPSPCPHRTPPATRHTAQTASAHTVPGHAFGVQPPSGDHQPMPPETVPGRDSPSGRHPACSCSLPPAPTAALYLRRVTAAPYLGRVAAAPHLGRGDAAPHLGRVDAAPYLRHVDAALQEGTVGGVVRAHVPVLAPVAGEGAADAGQAAAGDTGGEAGPATPTPPGLRLGASAQAAPHCPELATACRGSPPHSPHGLTIHTGVARQTLSRTEPSEAGTRPLDHQH